MSFERWIEAQFILPTSVGRILSGGWC